MTALSVRRWLAVGLLAIVRYMAGDQGAG